MTSKLIVNNIEADAGVSTITFGSEISASTFTGNVTGNLTGNVTGNVTSSSTSTFSSGLNVTGGSVGIGTDNPVSLLHLSDTSGALVINREIDAVNQINFRTINTQRGSIGANSGACFTVYDSASAEKLRITSSGNIGIGTDTPGAKLEVFDETSNTILNVKSGDAGAVMNLIDPSQRSSIEQNGTTLKIISDTGAEFASSDIRLQVDGSTKMRVQSTGNIAIDNGNLVFSTSGTGIDFSATSDASGSTSELLDDYEEGTWVPALFSGVDNGSGGAPSFDRLSGRYTKVGNTVFADFYIRFGAGTQTTGAYFAIEGLPFNLSNLSYGSPTGQWTRGAGTSTYQDVTSKTLTFYGVANVDRFNIYQDGNSLLLLADGTGIANKYIIGGFWYQTDS